MLGVTWGESYCVMGHVGESLSVLWVGWGET